MGSLKTLLDGKKTYISAFCVASIAGLQAANIITQQQADMCFAFAGAFGLTALRAAITKSTPS